jgi:hypothetical protein
MFWINLLWDKIIRCFFNALIEWFSNNIQMMLIPTKIMISNTSKIIYNKLITWKIERNYFLKNDFIFLLIIL